MEDLGNEKKQRWKPQGKLYFKTKSQGMKKKKKWNCPPVPEIAVFPAQGFSKEKMEIAS